MYAADCGLVVIDSLAALVTSSELESSADKAVVGGAALVIGKLTRKTTLALSESEKEDRYPTLLYINQISHKIGVMFGDPETEPGGKKPLFQSSIRLRLYGKNLKDPKYSETMPVGKETTFIVKKHKVPIYAASGKFTVAMVPYKGLKPGQSDDYNVILDLMKTYGLAKKADSGKGWEVYGAEYSTLAEFKEEFLSKPMFANAIRAELIGKISKEEGLLEEKDDNGA